MLGFMQTQKLKNRKMMLLDLQKLLLSLRTEICYCGKTVETLILEHPSSAFCKAAAADERFSQNPCTALNSAGDRLLQEKSDKKLFGDFVSGLGISNTDAQMDHIRLYEELLTRQIAEAEEDYTKRSKLCVSLGLFAGVTLSLLLI